MASRLIATGKSVTQETFETRTAENLDLQQILFRDKFVQEYLIDFRSDLALARCGVQNLTPASLKSKSYKLIREPYVAQEISRRLQEIRPKDVVKRGQVMAKLWAEANDTGNDGGTRVSACAHIAKMLGMGRDDAPTGKSLGVMMIPVLSMDDWQRMATQTQQALKQQVSSGE